MSCDFYMTIEDVSYCYDACGVFHVSLDLMRDIFMFSSSDVSENGLNISVLDSPEADITYYIDSLFIPELNPSHSMLNDALSEGKIVHVSGEYGLLKHDMGRYLALKLFGTHRGLGLFSNKFQLIENIEGLGWNCMLQNNTIFSNANGMTNANMTNANICRNILKQMPEERFAISENGIENTSGPQSIPFLEGDTISHMFTIHPATNQETLTGQSNPIPPRKYRIKWHLTNDDSYTNVIPVDSLADVAGNIYSVTHYGIPATATVPDAPTSVSVVAGNEQVTISFSSPENNGGSPIISYTVTSEPGNISVTGSSSPITVTGLTPGSSYTFTVIATNAVGNSLPALSNLVMIPTVPDAPTSVSAVAGAQQATVSFTAPINDGGSAITSYTVTSSPGGLTASASSSPITVTGLTYGRSYTFTVVATNMYGNSMSSLSSSPITSIFSLNIDADLSIYAPFDNTIADKQIWNYNKYFVDGSITNSGSPSYGSPAGNYSINTSIYIIGDATLRKQGKVRVGYPINPNGTLFNRDNFSFTLWTYITNLSLVAGKLVVLTPTGGGFIVLQYYNGVVVCNCDNTRFATRTITATNNTWVHIGFVVNGAQMFYYKNGALLGSHARTPYGSSVTNTNTIFVGANDAIDTAIDYTDDFRVYNKSLSESEIEQIYNYRGVLQ